jgi:hypothetical protein
MYRQIFTPNEKNCSITLSIPREWYGQQVEVIAFPVSTSDKIETDDDFYRLCGAWESTQSAEEMVAELKAARKFREKDLSFEK